MAFKPSIADLPAEIDLSEPDFFALREAVERGGFSFSVKDVSNERVYGRRIEMHVSMTDIPDHWQESPRGDWFDPAHFDINEFGRIQAGDRKIYERPDGIIEGFLFRGMSYEEFCASRDRGYFESAGGYNFEGQEGLTYFSKDAGQAAHYASGFAPWQFKPSPSRPAVLIQIKDPGGHVILPGTGENEVGLRGRIPFTDEVRVLFAHPLAVTPGWMQINEDRWTKRFVPGSAMGLTVITAWSEYELGLRAEVKSAENAILANEFINSVESPKWARRI